MIRKPSIEDIKGIGYYLGKIIIGLGLTMAIPIIIGIAFGEINPTLDFIISLEFTLIFGLLLTRRLE